MYGSSPFSLCVKPFHLILSHYIHLLTFQCFNISFLYLYFYVRFSPCGPFFLLCDFLQSEAATLCAAVMIPVELKPKLMFSSSGWRKMHHCASQRRAPCPLDYAHLYLSNALCPHGHINMRTLCSLPVASHGLYFVLFRLVFFFFVFLRTYKLRPTLPRNYVFVMNLK